jgi:transcriptional regulator with XRE-family HTH domain
MPLSERLRRSRIKLDLTLKDVNRLTGISVSFLSEIERGKTNPSIETIQKLANCYKVPIKDLMPDESRVLPDSLTEAKTRFDIPDEIIDLMLQVEFRSDKRHDTPEDWMQLYFSLKTLLGE